ncbi:hypothetical protein MKX08_004251 [Trichoderma sp. CBMAI-0020]|nr:hypothetical protein MKX08_004251 [Trichoderma sp. CBMAI-0020]
MWPPMQLNRAPVQAVAASNGTGGAEGCNGCPAYNNRMSKSAQLNVGQRQGGCHGRVETKNEPVPIDVNAPSSARQRHDCLRRRPGHPLTIEPEPAMRSSRNASPLPSASASDLAFYHQHNSGSRSVPPSLNDENKLAPLAPMNSTIADDRQSSLSPASFISSARKRSFSATEADSDNGADNGHESAKRISSIRSILNPSTAAEEPPVAGPTSADRGEYALPPLRSPGASMSAENTRRRRIYAT